MKTESMKFSVHSGIGPTDVQRIEHALVMVDPDARVTVDTTAQTVTVESWLMPEEFVVAFTDENIDVKIL